MIRKLFVANRGEIALRVIRACKELEIPVVIGYSDADRYSLPVFLADERICIGPSKPKESYLNIPSIISSIEITGADAVHPGYGFLSENIQFVEICNSARIIFVGPTPENLRMIGDKSLAKKIAKKAKVPVIPGYEENDFKKALHHAKKIGFPIMIKASAGGGGRGMRKVYTVEEFEKMWNTCKEEAKISFGEESLYIEKFIERPRHIEIQVLCDNKGNIYVFPERDCSIQRRHQKLIEESPSPFADRGLRKKLQKYAKKIVKYIKYRNAGTIEFLVDQNKNPYFIEMNTRIQVEHPVTECVTGIDLVKSQIKIADNSKLDFSHRDIKINYHAIECRINAEDPENNFMPSPGRIKKLVLPAGPGIRIDTHIYEGYFIPPYYDSLIMKLITYGRTREEAIERMKRALDEIVIEGIKTTVPLYKKIISHPLFLSGRYYVGFVDKVVSESNQKEVIKW
ncbi:MAG TPA: acetyl-CoA carboxylase biotin carboxylase subunit [bacterium]|nr:acetyl-CoA carboxylase biotin carboxylase subunit [bacterium]HOM27327.1 acetyl-CoA carboxylase biotin carboxylase subunit [bacterium]